MRLDVVPGSAASHNSKTHLTLQDPHQGEAESDYAEALTDATGSKGNRAQPGVVAMDINAYTAPMESNMYETPTTAMYEQPVSGGSDYYDPPAPLPRSSLETATEEPASTENDYITAESGMLSI